MFAHLHCHSNYSLLRGADRIETLLDRAAAMGMGALALTDTNALYGAIPFYKEALKRGIKPIIGAEIVHDGARAVLLAKNAQGYSSLCRIVTSRQLKKDFSLTEKLLKEHRGLVIISKRIKLLRRLRESGIDKDIYVELSKIPGKERSYRRALEFSTKSEIPPVATNNVHFAQVRGHYIHKVVSAIRQGCAVRTLRRKDIVSPQRYLKSPEQMRELFKDVPMAFENAAVIADECNFNFELGKTKYPTFDTPGKPFEHLKDICERGATLRYGGCRGKVKRRLDYELSIIKELKLSEYFLIVRDISEFAKRDGIPSVGRGSAADSLVCYVLKITDVDPIKHDLFFERFLNLEREDNPDIDLDFCWRRRDRVLDYVYERYGPERVAMISTHVTLRGRSAMREVTKALGIPIGEVEGYLKRLPFFGSVARIERAIEKIPECRDIPICEEPLRTIYKVAKYIDGYPRHLSVHPGGIVISPSAITDFIPLERAAKGINVTQFDMYPVEDIGLLKIDLLGQRSLSVIDDTIRSLKKEDGIIVNYERNDPLEDKRTKALIRSGNTIGCFYIESPAMRLLLRKLKCDTFEGLVAASSIIRPGVSESGMMREYIERYNGQKEVSYLHPSMEKHLKMTYGVMIYQEDVIRIANDFAGMSFGQADRLRKCMSKKRDWEAMASYRDMFVDGAVRRGASQAVANEAWRQIESFAGYAFCKAHSASYAMISYRAAYLKAHYPAEFMASVIANGGGFYHTCEYVEEARRMGIRILLPDINRSGYHFRGSRGTMRVGLSHVKGIRDRTIKDIVRLRREGFFVSLGDFLKRTNSGKKETENLIKCGAFDCFEFSRPELLWKLEMNFGVKGTENSCEPALPLRYGSGRGQRRILPRIRDYSLRTKLKLEEELLDFTGSAHPLELYKAVPRKAVVRSKELHKHIGKDVSVIGWVVTGKRVRTKRGDQMKFLTMEDESASFEVTLFPGTYREFGPMLYGRGPYIIRGKVEDEFGGITVTAKSILRV